MSRTPAKVTQSAMKRAIAGARAAGLQVAGVSVKPDGTIIVYGGENLPPDLGMPKPRCLTPLPPQDRRKKSDCHQTRD